MFLLGLLKSKFNQEKCLMMFSAKILASPSLHCTSIISNQPHLTERVFIDDSTLTSTMHI